MVYSGIGGSQSLKSRDSPEIVLLKDNEWAIIDAEPCRVIDFTAFAFINNDKIENAGVSMPYCVVKIECKKLSGIVTGYITHRIDFANLWKVFKERGLNSNEEVLMWWTKQHYKSRLSGFLSQTQPKLVIHICHKGAYEEWTNSSYRGTGEAGFNKWLDAVSPILELKPEVIDFL